MGLVGATILMTSCAFTYVQVGVHPEYPYIYIYIHMYLYQIVIKI